LKIALFRSKTAQKGPKLPPNGRFRFNFEALQSRIDECTFHFKGERRHADPLDST